MRLPTIRNNICTLFENEPRLIQCSNQEIADAYQDMFDGETRTPVESIVRCLRELRSEGAFLPNKDVRDKKDEAEKEFKTYYGNRQG